MIWKNRLLTLAFLLPVIAPVCAQQAEQSQTGSAMFSLTISTDSPSPRPTDDLVVTIKLRNTSSSVYYLPIKLEFKRAELNGFIPEVTNASGTILPRKPQPDEGRRRAYSMSEAGIKPGLEFEEKLDLSKLFDLTTPGTYTVRVHRVDRQTNVTVYSNQLTLAVGQ